MTTKTQPRKKRSSTRDSVQRTRGWAVIRWIETHCIHAEGDWYGKPFRLRTWQKELVLELYSVDSDGARVYSRALFGLPRGNGKTELAAAIGAYELAGGSRISPVVVVAAASWEQADLVFGALKTMFRESPTLCKTAEVFETEILLRHEPGRAYRVAAVAGTNEGQRPTCVIGDELHEWLGHRERVWTVLTSGAAKREGSMVLAITTAGWDRDSICYRLYEHGKRIASGEIPAEGFLFKWWEAPEGTPSSDRKSWKVANPALGDFLAEESLAQQLRMIPEHEFDRYHRNIWAARLGQWLPYTAWDVLAAQRKITPKTRIVLGFRGSYSQNATGLMGCTMDGHLFVLGCWERPADATDDWRMPRGEIDAAVVKALGKYDVAEFVCNPLGWASEIEQWQAAFGQKLFVDFPTTTSPKRMAGACGRLYAAVKAGEGVSHDGDPRLARHLQDAEVRVTRDGEVISGSELAEAAVIAYDRAMWHASQPARRPMVF